MTIDSQHRMGDLLVKADMILLHVCGLCEVEEELLFTLQ